MQVVFWTFFMNLFSPLCGKLLCKIPNNSLLQFVLKYFIKPEQIEVSRYISFALRFTSVSQNFFRQVFTEITSFGFRPVKKFLETGSLNAQEIYLFPSLRAIIF